VQTPLGPGTVFAHDFRVERLLASGGMGSVYVATQLSTGRRRALKLMRPELVADPMLRRRFEAEARVGARIASEHVVEVVAAGVADGTPFLAMELLDGEDLATAVARRGPLPESEVRRLVAQISHALDAAHRAGVVHRDLKPENVFLATPRRERGEPLVKLLDFGIAKIAFDAQTADTAAVGTLLWMAPEQTERGAALGPPTDIWALGLLAFFLLTGASFWPLDASPATMIRRLVLEPIPTPADRAREIGAALPASWTAWIARAIDRDPAARFATIAEARTALDALAGAPSVRSTDALAETIAVDSAIVPAAAPSGGRRSRVAALAIAALALAGGATFSFARRPGPAPEPAATTTSKSDAARVYVSPSVFRIPVEGSPRTGAAEPLVTIVVFGDYECPYTTRFMEGARSILARHADEVALVWKDLPLDFHPAAAPAARLARLARAHGGDAAYFRASAALVGLFASKPFRAVREPELIDIGASLGLDRDVVARTVSDAGTDEAVDHDEDQAVDFEVAATPTAFINGRRIADTAIDGDLSPVIDEALARARAEQEAAGAPRATFYASLTRGGMDHAEPRTFRGESVDAPCRGPANAKAVVRAFANRASGIATLYVPALERLIQSYDERIRLCWAEAPDPGDAESMRASQGAVAARRLGGDAGFWKMHTILLENGERFPPGPTPPRGFGRDALFDYARQAGIMSPYFRAELELDPQSLPCVRVRADLVAAGFSRDEVDFVLLVGDRRVGTMRAARRLIDAALAAP
jgi:protein-disulfide isomerase/tRNA A-37 threonylcarbamoyl transferase component Bud32